MTEDGHISHTSEYKEGVLDGVVEYYHHGNLISSAVFKNGTKQGREHVYLYKPDQTNNLQLVTFRSSFYIKNSVNQIIQDGELLDLNF